MINRIKDNPVILSEKIKLESSNTKKLKTNESDEIKITLRKFVGQRYKGEKMKTPNLFEVATSELSQDAFIAWLLQWGDIKYKEKNQFLHSCSINFIQSLLEIKEDIITVEAGRQWNHIDVWAKINDNYFLIIEDKKGTKEHSNQLERYRHKAEEKFVNKNFDIVPVYFKMDEQSDFSEVEKANYSIFTREKMLSVLENYKKSHDVLSEYYLYLKNLDNALNSYLTLPVNEWQWFAWRGFFSALQKKLDGAGWGYVSNPSGGFLGFWWNWRSENISGLKFNLSLQLEYDKLIVKMGDAEKNNRNTLRTALRSLLYKFAPDLNIQLTNYGRSGNWMGIVRCVGDYRITNEQGVLDMEQTLVRLRNFETLINRICETKKP